MLKKLNRISREIIYSNEFWNYCIDEYFFPNGKNGRYYYVETRGSTFIIAKNSNGKYLMNKQFRYLNGKESIEFPGGGIKIGIEPKENAISELLEETGYFAKSIVKIGEHNPFNGVTNEICSVFYTEDIELKTPNWDESEEFILMEYSEGEIINLIKSGEIWDGMTLAAWSIFYFSNYRKAIL